MAVFILYAVANIYRRGRKLLTATVHVETTITQHHINRKYHVIAV